jgi:tripartite-type tricarboxylate transporter receptor subunit TctC
MKRTMGIAASARVWTATLVAWCGLVVGAAAQPADYPNRRIRFIVPHVAGAAVDALARQVGQRMSELWGHPVIVENRTGAGGNIGAQAAARSDPDGYTLMFSTNGPLTTNAGLYRTLGFDPEKDFDGVVLVCKSPTLLVTSLVLPANNVPELIALAKKEPGKLSAGTGGHGTAAHFALAEMNKLAGIDIVHVPYRGAVPALADLSSNSLQIVIADPVAVLPFMQSAKVRVLAVTDAQRLAGLPDIPTIAEGGMPGFDVAAWVAITAPKGTPRENIEKLNVAINAMLKEPAFRQRLIEQGFNPVDAIPPAAVDRYVRAELPRWRQRVIDAGLEMQ